MARKGVDFAGARPSPRTLQAAGVECVLFYVGAPGDWRMPPRSLIDSYLAIGIECAAIYEEGAGSFAREGYQRGVQVGRNARRFLDGYGWGGPAYVATDVDITHAMLPAAVEAYRGVRDGAGRECGIYGGGLIVEAVRAQLGYRLLWRANASSWHHGAPANGLLVQQRLGPAPGVPDTDLNTVYVDKGGYWGQWAPGSITPAPNQPPEEDDMPPYREWSDADKDALASDVAQKVAYYVVTGQAQAEGQESTKRAQFPIRTVAEMTAKKVATNDEGITNLGDVLNELRGNPTAP